MGHFFHIEGLAAALGILGAAWAVVRWLYYAARNQQTIGVLVKHMYENEIPHLEHAMRRVCAKLGIDYDEPPPPPMFSV